MTQAAVAIDGLAAQARNARLGGLAGSLVLHALIAVLLLWAPAASPPAPPESMVVEVIAVAVPEPPLPAPPPPAPPSQAETLPPLPVGPPPPPPQLSEAPIAERSSPPPAPLPAPPRERPIARAPPPAPAPSPAPPARPTGVPVPAPTPQSTPLEAGRYEPGGGGAPDSVASQAVQDFILAQIARHWLIDVHGERYRNIVLYGNFVLLPNGMLASPFGKNDPWNPHAMIGNYDRYQGPAGEAIRSALETFLLAARQAQPFRLPPDGKADQARALPMRFRLGDLPG
jgi:hypothetical protein